MTQAQAISPFQIEIHSNPRPCGKTRGEESLDEQILAGEASVTPVLPRPRSIEFELPPELEAGEPPEARGLARDQVRLMVSRLRDDRLVHTRFDHLPDQLEAGDLLVINTSGTLNAALMAQRQDGTPLELHLSTHLPAELWVVELRRPAGTSTEPFLTAHNGEVLDLPAGGRVDLIMPYRPEQRNGEGQGRQRVRLWIATIEMPCPLQDYLERFGEPIRYSYVRQAWPNTYYQTVFATEAGSAEMPSAGRAFTPQLITRLVAKGVQIAPLLLHTGVASLEDHEPPYDEYYRVPAETAYAVNNAHAAGKRVIAVGTTAVRALETVSGENGISHPGEGWTRLVITPERGLFVVDGLLTGFHEPRSSHLAMLEALAGEGHLHIAYGEALRQGYLWHEFGDLHLILP
jgi:S-adenosylmethionine:tRNA ribosyltransferase-isomerase